MKRIIFLSIFIFYFFSPVLAAPRYISLAPSTTEILFALGLNESIVGISSYCKYPPEAKTKIVVGDFSHPNIEKIIALKPDYIFCTGLEQAPAVAQLRRLKFPVYVADPANMEELLKTIAEIGTITHRENEAAKIIGNMRNDIAMVSENVKSIPQAKRIKVFVEIWHEPLMTAGKGSFVDEMVALAGGINIAHNVPRPYCYFNSESVINLNPGCIIMTYMDKEPPLRLIESRFGWDKIDAVKNKRVFNDISEDILLRPGPRITEGVKELYKRFYAGNI